MYFTIVIVRDHENATGINRSEVFDVAVSVGIFVNIKVASWDF